MVATQQHVRHPHSTVLARSRIVWVLRSTAQFQTERLLHSTPHVPQHTRHLAHAGFQHGHGSQLSARQDIGTYRQLSTGEQLRDPCIKPFISPTEQDHVSTGPCQFPRDTVIERTTPRGHDQDISIFPHPLGSDGEYAFKRRSHHVHPNHHSRSTTIWRVINLFVVERSELADIMHRKIYDAFLHGLRDRVLLTEP